MNLEKLTVKSQEALQAAQTAATQFDHPEITPEHLLLALLNQDGGLVPILLVRIGVDVDGLRRRVGAHLESRPRARGGAAPHVGDRLRLLLEAAERRATAFHDDFVSVEHMLLAMLESREPAAGFLGEAGVEAPKLLEVLKAIRGAQR